MWLSFLHRHIPTSEPASEVERSGTSDASERVTFFSQCVVFGHFRTIVRWSDGVRLRGLALRVRLFVLGLLAFVSRLPHDSLSRSVSSRRI